MPTTKKKMSTKIEKYLREFLKCKSDFEYFCRNYIILELPENDILLTPYKPQIALIDTLMEKKNVIVLKSRQIGISTIIQAYITWLCCFYKNIVIGIISKDAPEATSFNRTILKMLDNLPDWLRPKYDKRTERTFILKNGCKCYASPVNPQAPQKTLRGKSITFLVIDEAAFIEKLDTAWTGMIPALSTNQKHARLANAPHGIIVLSTPNKTVGVGQWFYKKYTDARGGDDIFEPFVIHWKDVKELAEDKQWYQDICKRFGHDERKIQQEMELKFLSSEGSFFSEATIQKLQDNKIEPKEKIKIYNGEIWKFQDPIPGKHYLIGVDTASEFGADKSGITVWDYETIEQVWEYRGKCAVTDFIKVVKQSCILYPGTLVIETTGGYGNQVVEAINRSSFSHLLYKEKKGKDKNIITPGVSTNSKTRPLMIDSLYTYITETPEIAKSERLILELIGLVDKGGRIEADQGCHDDLAMSTAMAFYVRRWDPPVMLSVESDIHNSDFSKIMTMNDEVFGLPTNKNILNKIKENLPSDGGIINTLEFLDVEIN